MRLCVQKVLRASITSGFVSVSSSSDDANTVAANLRISDFAEVTELDSAKDHGQNQDFRGKVEEESIFTSERHKVFGAKYVLQVQTNTRIGSKGAIGITALINCTQPVTRLQAFGAIV